jgi:hypothetical protein
MAYQEARPIVVVRIVVLHYGVLDSVIEVESASINRAIGPILIGFVELKDNVIGYRRP